MELVVHVEDPVTRRLVDAADRRTSFSRGDVSSSTPVIERSSGLIRGVNLALWCSAWPLPPPDPVAIRACLTPGVAAEFDAEWNIVLDKAKQSKDLAPVHALLAKWWHFAYAELKDSGSYFRLLATAARTLATGEAPAGSVSGDEVRP